MTKRIANSLESLALADMTSIENGINELRRE
jgi:hypothetical protein